MQLESPGPQASPNGNVQSSGLRAMFSAFEIRPFRWVWTAALSGNSGRFAVVFVAGWDAYRLGHHSSLWPSAVSMLLLVPSMFLGLIAGSIADRRNRARMAATGQLINALSCIIAFAFTLVHRLDLAELLVLTAAIGVGNSIQAPAWQAMIPDLVGRDRLMNASMIARIAQQGAELTGPALATIVLTTMGLGAAFLTCAALYLIGMVMFFRVRHRVTAPKLPPERLRVTKQVRDGLSYVSEQRPLGTLLIWVGLHCSLTMASIGILPAVATTNLHGNASAYGLLLTAFGLGSVVGPLVMMALGRRHRIITILLVSGVLSGLPLITLGLVHEVVVDVLSSALAGAAQAVFMAGIYSANQGVSRDSMRGRVASVQLSLTTGAMGLASIGWGALVAYISPGITLAAPGAIFIVTCIPFVLRRRTIASALYDRTPREASSIQQGASTPSPSDLEDTKHPHARSEAPTSLAKKDN